jgi:hypothetical protein
VAQSDKATNAGPRRPPTPAMRRSSASGTAASSGTTCQLSGSRVSVVAPVECRWRPRGVSCWRSVGLGGWWCQLASGRFSWKFQLPDGCHIVH